MSTWQDDASRDLMSLGGRLALLTRGEGSHVWDADDRRYLDFLGGIAVNCLGHAHPVFVEAVSKQAATLAHISNYFASPAQLELAARLKRLAGTGDDGRVFLSNSGTEANEMAIKLARLHGGKTGKSTILVLNGAFHGRTMGALSITPKAAYRDPFEPVLPGVRSIDATLEALEAAFDDSIAALFVEPIQGEAGVVPMPDGFLARARELATERGALLVLDEVQTGSGRTGEWFAFQREGIVPDAVTLAKSIGAGFPLGALITFGAASDLFYPGTHNSTFGGNPLASAVANAVLGYIESEGLLENVTARGAQLRTAVAELPLVSGTRGEGLLIGITLTAPVAAEVRAAAHERGLIVNAPDADVIRIAPAYTIGDAEIEEFLTLFGEALSAVAATIPTPTETHA
ncbi:MULTISPECIES: acetylornithine transaminase [Microbacterium]|uniref:Acetylornithine aminotransferase n=1 Tax=Microbacterium barkeri TaxID=33917 RepID=A0A9W6LXK8_9MICO|nr:acetylornithine transaminase [Microbacterium barkeri]MDR6875459.1 acetylornithine aminotransferase [Microbacterium barkeri]GLJ62591.1 acetylornithine aminotransferase [Microbacterium barkeri]